MSTHYDYTLDKPIADKTEMEVANIIEKATGYKLEHMNDDNKYDLKFRKGDNVFYVEVKEDFTCNRTGNVGLEYSCRGKPSGISVSKANYYCYKIHQPNRKIGYYLVTTKVLKTLIDNKLYKTVVNGGDIGSDSLNYLFDLSIIQNNSHRLMEVNDEV